MADSVMTRDEGTYDEAQLLIMERHGYPEETYYTFSYSPVPNDEGGRGGLICANTDDTRRVIGERQLARCASWRRQSRRRSADDACTLAVEALRANSARPAVRAALPRGRKRHSARCGASRARHSRRHCTIRDCGRARRRHRQRQRQGRPARRRQRQHSRGRLAASSRQGAPSCRSRARASDGHAARAGGRPESVSPVRRRYRGFLELVADRSPAASRTPRPTRRSAAAPRRSPSSTARRPRSSATSATSSARRSR